MDRRVPKNKSIRYEIDINIDDYYKDFKKIYKEQLNGLKEELKSYSITLERIQSVVDIENNGFNRRMKRQVDDRLNRLEYNIEWFNEISNVTPMLYKTILKEYYKAIIEEIFKGYKYKLLHKLGRIFIRQETITPKRTSYGELLYAVNWKATMKKKADFLNSGVKPEDLFSKERFEEYLAYYIDKGEDALTARIHAKADSRVGKNYFVYYEGGLTHWVKFIPNHNDIPNYNLYSFVPARGFVVRTKKLENSEKNSKIFPIKIKQILTH